MKCLFIDRQHIQWLHGLRQVFHQPVKHEAPILVPAEPWEGCNVRVDEPPLFDAQQGVWRMWYTSYDPGEAGLAMLAESGDAIHWRRPSLQRVEYNGSLHNNIIARQAEQTPHSLFVRDDQETDPTRRFKGLAWFNDRHHKRLQPYVSADGLDWTALPGESIASEDTKKLAHDPRKGQFIATVKGLHGCGVTHHGAAELGRVVYLSTSPDFVHWSRPELIFHADEVDQEQGQARMAALMRDPDRLHPLVYKPGECCTDIYYLPVFVYEDLYLALPALFNQSGTYFTDSGFKNQDGLVYPTLAASRDLRRWDRLSREPFLEASPLSCASRFDTGCIFASAPLRKGDELWFYYTAGRVSHIPPALYERQGHAGRIAHPVMGVFLARLRVDGFASLHAGNEPGWMMTRPLTVTGTRLCINANAGGGEIRVEVRDAQTGRAIAGYALGDYRGNRVIRSDDGRFGALRIGAGARFVDDPQQDDTVPMTGDFTAAAVRWKEHADLGTLRGREVRLFFQLRQAHLYSFWFED